MESGEIKVQSRKGWVALPLLLAAGGVLAWLAVKVFGGIGQTGRSSFETTWAVIGWSLAITTWSLLWGGFFTLQPNVAVVLTLFGKYVGTVRESGFHWANPFYLKKKVSLRAHNLNGPKIKVNDLRGNPIEIALIVVWRVVDTAKATFDVEDYHEYVAVQSEGALRHLAMSYPYDNYEGDTRSLRGSVDEVSHDLLKEVQFRAARAGIHIEDARISHLAYAQEIAGAMLQRQQAEAIVAARQRIVDGAVGMVEMALARLEEHKTIDLDNERKAHMVSNLLVVLCGDRSAHPVINTGGLY